MSKLDDLIKELCPDGVESLPFGEIADIGKGIQFNKENMFDSGTYPVINGGITPSGFIEQYNQTEQTITISQGGASAGFVNWIETKFWAGAHCYVIKPKKQIVFNRYVYHFLKSQEYKLQECQYGAGIPALAKSTVAELEIPVPPLPVQEEIVRILDKFTMLTAELTARRKQYEYYRDSLLSPESISREFACKLGKVGNADRHSLLTRETKVEHKKLNEIAEIYDGTHQTPEYKDSGIPFISVENIDDIYSSKKFISTEAYNQYKIKPQLGDLFMTRIGSIGKCAVMNKEMDLALCIFSINPT